MSREMREIRSGRTGDHYYEIRHPSGLQILLYPKEHNNSTYAVFGTRYGSVDTTFQATGEEACTVPEGIAHYLEHKLLRVRRGTRFLGMLKQAPAPMRLPLLKPLATFSPARIIFMSL